LRHFDLVTGLTVGFVGDGGGLEGAVVVVEGVDGRDVGTAGVDVGGCCVGAFGVVVVIAVFFATVLSRRGDAFEGPG
jgi:hypothetical protein